MTFQKASSFNKGNHDSQSAVMCGVGPDGYPYVYPAAYLDAGDASALICTHNFATDADQAYVFDCSGMKTAQIEIICAGLAGVLTGTLTYTYKLTAAGPEVTYGVGPTTLNAATFSSIVDFTAVKGKLLKIAVAKVGITGGTVTIRISGRW
jgi:hypothetical protein